MDTNERALLTPIVPEPEADPDDTPTQRIRLTDLDGPSRDALLAALRRLDEDETALDARPEADGSLAPPLSMPGRAHRTRSTPLLAFSIGFAAMGLFLALWLAL